MDTGKVRRKHWIDLNSRASVPLEEMQKWLESGVPVKPVPPPSNKKWEVSKFLRVLKQINPNGKLPSVAKLKRMVICGVLDGVRVRNDNIFSLQQTKGSVVFIVDSEENRRLALNIPLEAERQMTSYYRENRQKWLSNILDIYMDAFEQVFDDLIETAIDLDVKFLELTQSFPVGQMHDYGLIRITEIKLLREQIKQRVRNYLDNKGFYDFECGFQPNVYGKTILQQPVLRPGKGMIHFAKKGGTATVIIRQQNRASEWTYTLDFSKLKAIKDNLTNQY